MIERIDIYACFSKAMNTHSKENAPLIKLIANKKIISLTSNNCGTLKINTHIKPKDKQVAKPCKIKNAWTLFDNNSLLSLTLTHSLMAKFGIPIFANIKK